MIAGSFGWSLAELKRMELRELLDYARLAASRRPACPPFG